MKALVLAAALLLASCCKSPVALEPFTICNTVESRTVEVYTGYIDSLMGVMPIGRVCIIYGVDCVPVDVPDGTIVVCEFNGSGYYYAKAACKGEYWDL